MRERLIIELVKKEQFESPKNEDSVTSWRKKFCFSYEIQGLYKDRNKWQQTMQQDVNRFFGSLFGIEVRMETRKFNCLVLNKTKDGLLTTTGKKAMYEDSENSWQIINYPFGEAINQLTSSLENMNAGRPFLDETGIEKNMMVDMQLTGDLNNLENMRHQLQRYGLDIIEREREVEVLVIRDKNINN